jgi:3-methylfumaryl-CoA hydratase
LQNHIKMPELNSNDPIITMEHCNLPLSKKVAAMLDLDPMLYRKGDLLPRGWHFYMLSGDTRKSMLRSDGFPGLGVAIPDLGLPRLLLGGRTVLFQQDIPIGAELEKTSFIKSITPKTGSSGPMAIVTLQHELRLTYNQEIAITETQTYVLLSSNSEKKIEEKTIHPPILAAFQKQVIPDETLLFQYSALGFNSHKIHLDRNYAQNVEMLPDLVVNGGLATLLLTEYVRLDLRLEIEFLKVKHLSPLYCNRKLTIAADQIGPNMQVKIYDDKNVMAVEADITIK